MQLTNLQVSVSKCMLGPYKPRWSTVEIPTPDFMCTHSTHYKSPNVFHARNFNSEAKCLLDHSTLGQIYSAAKRTFILFRHIHRCSPHFFPCHTLVYFPPFCLSLCQWHIYFDLCGLAVNQGGVCFFSPCSLKYSVRLVMPLWETQLQTVRGCQRKSWEPLLHRSLYMVVTLPLIPPHFFQIPQHCLGFLPAHLLTQLTTKK